MADFVVSEIDQKLSRFCQHTPKTAAEQAEINKYRAVYAARDEIKLNNPKAEHKSDPWDQFNT